MAKTKIQWARLKNLPTERPLPNGKNYFVENEDGSLSIYSVTSDGEPKFIRGVSEEDASKINRLTPNELSKLEGLDTQSEIDDKIQAVDDKIGLASGSVIPITGTVLPQGADIPSYITTTGKAELQGGSSGKTYTQTGGSPITVGANNGRYAYYNKATNIWTAGEEYPLPQMIPDGDITSGNNRPISGNTAYQNNLMLVETTKELIGIPSTYFEVGSISDFTSNLSLAQGTVILDRQFMGVNVLEIKVNVVTAGNIVIGSYAINSGVASRSKFITIPLVVGVNTLPDFEINDGEYFGYSYNTASNLARIGVKNEITSNGYWAEAVNISTGTTLGAKKFNQRIGLSIVVEAKDSLSKDVEASLKDDDLTLSSNNLFDINTMVVPDYLMVNNGDVLPGINWAMARIPVDKLEGQTIFWGNSSSSRSLMYAGFVNASDVLISGESVITFNPNTGGGSGVVPVGAKFLIVDIKEPSDSSGVYTTFSANTGDSLKPYSPYNLVISEIKGIALQGGGGGEDYDQSLNTTDNVSFESVDTPALSAVAILSKAPEWDETGVAPIDIDYEYLYPVSSVGYQRRVRRS